ncbi:DUF4249 family protein [Maribacter sp. CXY002]|uniref:DUF4249 family protein n=1 Tax=Maribacter luteocoastalis TaxID=3407671 RepID=UPI003B678B64
MGKSFYFFLLSITIFSIGCEDVIDVDLPTEKPRLVVDAVIRIDTSEAFTMAQVKIALSSSFFENNDGIDVDMVQIQNLEYVPQSSLDQNFILLNSEETGVYRGSKNTNFFTEGPLDLHINYGEESFYARTRFVPSVPIDTLAQGDETLFSEDETEVKVTFTDIGDRDDFYIIDFGFNEFLVTEDEFYQGQTFGFSYFYDEKFESGRELEIGILGADEPFYNYMNQVIVQSGGDQGPFQTPATTVRGNVFNVTGIDNMEVLDNVERTNNFALGYFAVVQEYKKTLTIQ